MVAGEKKCQATGKPATLQKEFPQMQGSYGIRHSWGEVSGQQSWERQPSRKRLYSDRRKVEPGVFLPSEGERGRGRVWTLAGYGFDYGRLRAAPH